MFRKSLTYFSHRVCCIPGWPQMHVQLRMTLNFLSYFPTFRVLELQASAALPDLYDTELYLQLSNM